MEVTLFVILGQGGEDATCWVRQAIGGDGEIVADGRGVEDEVHFLCRRRGRGRCFRLGRERCCESEECSEDQGSHG